jgi:hypothetical protein
VGCLAIVTSRFDGALQDAGCASEQIRRQKDLGVTANGENLFKGKPFESNQTIESYKKQKCETDNG